MVSQKMKATASTQGFTLVELIVVITILAILGTIGFISLQGYSAQSRNSKRTSDIASLVKQVSIKSTEGLALSAFINTTDSAAAAKQLTTPSVGGAATDANTYFAGIPNYVTLGLSSDGFKDPSGPSYAVGSTTRAGGAFQFAATLEDGASKKAFVSGNYNQRTQAATLTDATNTIAVADVNISDNTIMLADADVGKFRTGDTIIVDGSGLASMVPATLVIGSISADGKTIKTSTDITVAPTTAGQMKLGANETAGLIKGTDTNPVVKDSDAALPYTY